MLLRSLVNNTCELIIKISIYKI